jgi:hypothetical protein
VRAAQALLPAPADPAAARRPLCQRPADAPLCRVPLAVHDRAARQEPQQRLGGIPRHCRRCCPTTTTTSTGAGAPSTSPGSTTSTTPSATTAPTTDCACMWWSARRPGKRSMRTARSSTTRPPCLAVQPPALGGQRASALQPRRPPPLGHRGGLPGGEAPGLPLRARLRARLQRPARLPLPHAHGASVQHPGTVRRSTCSASTAPSACARRSTSSARAAPARGSIRRASVRCSPRRCACAFSSNNPLSPGGLRDALRGAGPPSPWRCFNTDNDSENRISGHGQPPRDAAQRLGDIRHRRAGAAGCAGGRSCFRAASSS